MNTTNIKEMLTAYHLNPENDAVYSFFEKDNIWKILDVERYEPSHSAFLVWFFSQKSVQNAHVKYLLNLLVAKASDKILSNGWNKTDHMQIFASAILTGAYTIKAISVTPELVINKISRIRYTDRLDVYIKCTLSVFDNEGHEQERTLEIIIENKVDSTEGKFKKAKEGFSATAEEEQYSKLEQTEKYYYASSREFGNRIKDDVDYQLFVFLTPDGRESKSKNYILITYQDLVDFVFENYLKRNDIDSNTKNLLEVYLHNLGNPYNKNNKGILAMDTVERELLVAFYNRNKQLFETTIEAMIQQSTKDGDTDSAEEFLKVASGLKTAGRGKRYYQINGSGSYTNREIIAEYIKFKLDKNVPFAEIYDEISKVKCLGNFISDDPKGVTQRKGDGPYSFEYNDSTYYVTTQLRDNEPKHNFRIFREYVSKKEKDFKITEISK